MNTQLKKLLRGKKACDPKSYLSLKKKNGSITKGAVKIGEGQYGKVYRGCVDDSCKKFVVYKEIKQPKLTEKTNNVPLAGFVNAIKSVNPKMEFTIAKKLENYGVPKVYLHKTCDGKDYLYSEFIDGEELDKWFRTRPTLDAVRSVMAQIIYNLYRIHKKYPGFRHHDLHGGNIMVRKVPNKDIQITMNKKYSIPNGGVEAVIIDFGFSTFPRLRNPLINAKNYVNIGISRKSNKFYDLHLFLNTMYGLCRQPSNRTERIVKTFVESLFSPEYLSMKSTKIKNFRLRGNMNHTLPSFETALMRPFFTETSRMNQLRKLFTKPKVSPKQVVFKAPKVANRGGNAQSRAIAILKASKQVTKKKPVVKITKK
jgi:serine/threonine protein kinase